MNIRQSTARTVIVGPILDADGVAKTDEVVDSILASKNGADPAALNGSATLTHKAAGYYRLALTTSDTDTLGCLELILSSGTNTMPVKALNVMTQPEWDAYFAIPTAARIEATQYAFGILAASGSASFVNNAFYPTGGSYNGHAVFFDPVGSLYLWFLTGGATWHISEAVGTDGASYWTGGGSDVLGTYTNQGSATGNAILSPAVIFPVNVSDLEAAHVWAALTSELTTSGSIGKWLLDTVMSKATWTDAKAAFLDAAITSRHASGAAVAKSPATLATADVTGNLPVNVVDWKGATAPAMTGDAFARLGAPTGESVSADIAGIHAKTTNLPASPAAVGSAMTLAANQHVIVDSGTVTTLTNLPAAPTDWLTAAAVKADAVDKIQANLSTLGGLDLAATALSIIEALAAAHGAGSWATATGFALSSVWTPTLAGYLDVAISSRQASGSAVTLPTTPPAGYGGSMSSEQIAELSGELAPAVANEIESIIPTPSGVWSYSDRTLTGSVNVSPPVAYTSDADIYYSIFKNSTRALCARVRGHDGNDLTPSGVSAVAYSIYELDDHDPDERDAVTGHSAVSLTPANVLFATLQTDNLATGYNFRHTPPIGTSQAFTIAGRSYLVEYTITPTSGEKIVLRFRVDCI